jgi:excisionase family DNA binding protein
LLDFYTRSPSWSTRWGAGVSSTADPLALILSLDALEAIAARAAELVVERLGEQNGSPWLTREAAAKYLSLPVSRLEKDRTIPCHRDGRRVLYHRDELDAYLLR